MKICYFSTTIWAAMDTTTRASPNNSIELCQKHLQEYFLPASEGYSLEKFNQEIFDDDCNLDNIHISHFKPLFYSCSKCEKCMASLPKQKIFCKVCYTQNLFLSACVTCKKLESLAKQVEIYRLYFNKFIIKKYAQGSISHFFEEENLSYPVFFPVMLSGLSYSSKELRILSTEILNSIKRPDRSMEYVLNILNACAEYHTKYENIDSMDLFRQLIESKNEYPEGYACYLAMRFDFNFYNSITSENFFNLIKLAKIFNSNSYMFEYRTFIADVIIKAEYLGFIMDKEDFFNLIDLSFENEYKNDFLYFLFSIKEYVDMLTEEKLISMLEKIFKIYSEVTIYKNLRIFKDKEEYYNLNFAQYNLDYLGMSVPFDIDELDNSNSSERNEISSNELESFELSRDPLSSELTENQLYTEVYTTSEGSEIIENYDDSASVVSPESICTNLIYIDMIDLIFNDFSRFTPNGLVKIACIIFSLLEQGVTHREDFKDLLRIFYSKQRFENFNLEHVLDIIDLHLKYNIPYYHIEFIMHRIFVNIKRVDELDYIFDYIFSAPNKKIMVGIFAKLYDTKRLSESKINKLIHYSVDKLHNGFINLFLPAEHIENVNFNFQLKYIKEMINQSDIKKIDFSAFVYSEKDAFKYLSKNEFNFLLERCIKHKKFKEIIFFFEYLDLEQLQQIPERQLSKVIDEIFKKPDGLNKIGTYYIETPFFYYTLPYLFDEFIISLENEDAFYINVVFESIMKNPLFQKCIDIYNNMKVQPEFFEQADYLNKIINVILAYNGSHSDLIKCFYENLNLKRRIAFKAELVKNILYKSHLNNTKQQPESLSEAAYIVSLLEYCILIPPELKNEKIEFFINNFNSADFEVAELFNSLISQIDLDILIETYNERRTR